jgi:hypothetical protein
LRPSPAWAALETPQGEQTAYLQGGDAHVSIPTGVLEAGVHTVSFYAARRGYDGDKVNPVQVKIDGILIGQPIAPVSTDFVQYTTSNFKLDTNGPHIVELVSTNGQVGDVSTFIDSVSINKVKGLN